MEAVFRSFCSFGADKGTAPPLMDGTKLVKLCRDLKLLDKNLTSTDVDIIYSKVKSKTERKITFKQFEEALKLMADKKSPGTEDALDKLKTKILEGGGPVAHGATKATKTGAVERLTETPSKASSSGLATGQKAANAHTSSKATGAMGRNGKSPSSQATGKSIHSSNGKADGKTGGGGKSKDSRDAQKPIRAPDSGGKESNTASETVEKEDANEQDSGPGKKEAQRNTEPAETVSQTNEEELTVRESQETQVQKQDS